MSPPTENVPRTPDRRSSTQALFTAFRSLTGGRLTSPTPPPSTSSATCTPARTPSLGSLRPGSLASPQTADGALQRLSLTAAQKNAKSVVGGPPELQEHIAQLDRDHSLVERAMAVEKVSRILEEYPVQHILGLWAVASDLLLPEQSDDVAEIGYTLLRSCVAVPNLSTIERNVFFDAATSRKHDRFFDRRLDIIDTLTRSGHDIAACEPFVIPFILASLDSCFKASGDASRSNRKAGGKRTVANASQEVENLIRIFQFTIDICKFNAKMFTDDDLDLLLRRTVRICENTTKESDMQHCIRLFDTVITYVHIPTKSLRPCLEVLCAIHKQISNLQEQTWNTLSNLFKSHVGQAAISSLLHTLLDGPSRDRSDDPTRRSRKFSLYRGTIQVLQQLLFENGQNELPKVPLVLLFPALKTSIEEPHHTQEEIVVGLINTVLTQESTRELLLAETNLTNLLDIMRTCTERDDARRRGTSADSSDHTRLATNESVDGMPSGQEDNTPDPEAEGIASTKSASRDDRGAPVHRALNAKSRTARVFYRDSADGISQILGKLDQAFDSLDFVSRAAVVELFMHLIHRVNDSSAEKTIVYLATERYLNPSNGNWFHFCQELAEGILVDTSRPRTLRIKVVQTIRETYETVEQLCPQDAITQCSLLLLNRISAEEDAEVLAALVNFAVDVADKASGTPFSSIVDILQDRLKQPRGNAASTMQTWQSQPVSARDVGSASDIITTAFVRLFTRSVVHSARKTRILYEHIRAVAGSDKYEHDARLTALKLLFRLRADSRHAVVVSASSEGERLAAELCRTEETAVSQDKAELSIPDEQTKSDDGSAVREQRKASTSSPHVSLNRSSRLSTISSRQNKPLPPLWMYPGPKGLPEDPRPESSRVVFSHIDADQYPLSDDVFDMEITLWLEVIISLLQRPPDWEIYSYVLVHLGPQLSNQALVRSCVVQLRMLRSVLCEQVRNASFHEPPSHTLLKKADVAVCVFHVLTVIISYHEYFEKSEEDDLVKAFLQGIVQWDRTSKWCIHALSVCMFEIPLSVSKSLDSIVQKMSQIITKPATAIHILEFLTSLARLPELFKNFREDEFKLVFGVCFRYLQHIRDQRERASRSQPASGPLRDIGTSPDPFAKKPRAIEDDLPQYLYSLGYHVITFWFMALKMEDRPKQIPWITRNLCYADSLGRQVLEEQGQVIVDIMNMVAWTDRDQTSRDDHFAKLGDGEIWKKTWIVGHGLVTIETAARTGISLVTTRRPCGTRFLTVRPLLTSPPRHQVPITIGLASEAFYSDSYVGILPDDIFQSFYGTLDLSNPPIPLPDDDMMRRALTSFDRIATVDSYKVGVIYIGEGQTDEREIFMNDIGSPAYTSFLRDLGTLCRLKDAKFNTGGLDTRGDMDGEFTYCWRDRCMELVFHITTMMPTNRDDDMTYPNKKRHIGNDFVNIIFNDSGLPYNFDTFPSAFNYVHIVISPESRASFVDRRLDADPDGRDRYYKVQAISRHDFPDVSPAVETKILCGKHLAAYCRLIAINACVFSSVWSIRDGGESISSWRTRLREIKRLRERYGAAEQPAMSPSSPGGVPAISSPPSRDQNGASPFQRMSVVTHMTDATSRSSISSSSHDPS